MSRPLLRAVRETGMSLVFADSFSATRQSVSSTLVMRWLGIACPDWLGLPMRRKHDRFPLAAGDMEMWREHADG